MTYSRLAGSIEIQSDRTARYHFSDDAVARDGHRIMGGAWRLANYLRNPVFLWAHDLTMAPIGRVVEIGETNGNLGGLVEYVDGDVSPFAEMIFRMVRGGYLNATSVRWDPIAWKPSNDRSRPGGLDFSEVDLMEISQVPVPALPSALATARHAGIDTRPMTTWATRCLDLNRKDMTMTRSALNDIRKAGGAPTVHATAAPQNNVRFPTLGSQLRAIAEACRAPERAPDPRLVRAPLGMNEGDPAAGGFGVQTNFVSDLIGSMYDQSDIASRCDRRPTEGPLADIKMPGIDESSRADGSRWGGIQSYWVAEADSVSASFPRFRQLEFSAKKLVIVIRGTEELLNDSPLLESHIQRGFAEEAAFKIDYATMRGTGAGQPLGFLNSSALITVAKETGQANATIVAENIQKMWSRLPASSRKRAVWLINEDAEEQLEKLVNVVGTSGSATPSSQGLYMPAGNSEGNAFPLLKGRPVIAVEQAPVLGSVGDISLVDLSKYILLDGGAQPAVSAHVAFLNDEIVWRFVVRIDGQPAFKSPVTPFNGGSTRSPFVTLGSR